MSKKIIDDVYDLINLSEDELNEVLLDEKYNKALLRELVRRSLKTVNEYKKAFEYEKYEREETQEVLKRYERVDLK